MDNYLKIFKNHTEYEQYKNGGNEIPVVSHCLDDVETHTECIVIPVIKCIYEITSTTEDVLLTYMNGYANANFSSMKVDGVELQNLLDTYRFSTLGMHTAEFILKNPTTLNAQLFADDNGLTSLRSIELPSTVNYIEMGALHNCGVETIIMNSDVPPSLQSSLCTNQSLEIRVPTVNVYKADSNWSYYENYIVQK